MPNIRHDINMDTEEISGYTGLLGAILNQAVKDLQKSYGKLIEDIQEQNYYSFKINCLFFERDCNGYCEQELSKYIFEKALKFEEENHNKNKVKFAKEYIKEKNLASIIS